MARSRDRAGTSFAAVVTGALLCPTRVGRYELIAHLATGGMSQVYLAHQIGPGAFEREVVLKVLPPERANVGAHVAMFLDEARLTASLHHQNIIEMFDISYAHGTYFMVMRHVPGENVQAILKSVRRRRSSIPLEIAVRIVGSVAAGLHHAHERGIVHRDVSPTNIMVGCDGSIKLVDFGIAKAEGCATKTIAGTVKGKTGYMSPEQCNGQPIDHRTDIFALGVCLYELTTMHRAFKGDHLESMKRIAAGALVVPSQLVAGYPPVLEEIVLNAVATDPGDRFGTALHMVNALDAIGVTATSSATARFMDQLFDLPARPPPTSVHDAAHRQPVHHWRPDRASCRETL